MENETPNTKAELIAGISGLQQTLRELTGKQRVKDQIEPSR